MMEKRKYPIGPEHYTLYEEVGHGVSASVHRALCLSFNEIVAIKILDFERDNVDLNNISREAQTMVLVDHPNVLKSHCSFVNEHNLWVVMPYMAGGSCLHILKAAYPDGFEEVIIATILREVLKGLEYLHHHGHIHRDVKAGNVLIGAKGAIKLGDFGVSACLFDSGDRQRVRNTFVGTPCWMAPEVMEQLHGYDFKADIWSFGITALELAHGHAPFSKYPPMKVLLMTLQNAPPSLDYERDKKFSKSFKQMIASCLVKDPSKRPSAKKLLKNSFFKQAKSNEYISKTLLEGLPALGERIKALKKKEEEMLAQKKMPDGQKEELSQNEYKRGISGWNFNLDNMKAQASLIQDEEFMSYAYQGSSSSFCALDYSEKQTNSRSSLSTQPLQEMNCPIQYQSTLSTVLQPTINTVKVACNKSDDDPSIASSSNELVLSPRQDFQRESNPCEVEVNKKSSDDMPIVSQQRLDDLSSNVELEESSNALIKEESVKQYQPENIYGLNGAAIVTGINDISTDVTMKQPKSIASTEDDEKAKPPVIQQKGRFKVTSENVDLEKVGQCPLLQKSYSIQVLTQHPGLSLNSSPDVGPLTPSRFLYPTLQTILLKNISQRESILSMMKQISSINLSGNKVVDGGNITSNVASFEKSVLEDAHDREKELLHEITDLQWRLIHVQEELQKYKTDNAQVE